MILINVSELAVDDVVLRANDTTMYAITAFPAFADYPVICAAVKFPTGMEDIKYWGGPEIKIRIEDRPT